jgi:hypothetical protein
MVDGRIRRAITENLRAKGFSPIEVNKADLLVTYYTSLNSQMRFHTTGWGYGYGWGWGPYWTLTAKRASWSGAELARRLSARRATRTRRSSSQ